ncbi:MAG: sulfite exporter TauE/SafE family protein [Burkholderiales bacterium]|nr:sulfite exporter TauE/SafE family protein [Burkholderiales bacterium]
MTELAGISWEVLAVLAAAAFAGSIIFGLTGFGAALITIPVATHFVPLPFALALYALMDLGNAFRIGFERPRNAVRAEWVRLVPMIVVGTALGVTVLVNLPRRWGMLALGVFVLAYAAYALLRPEARGTIGRGWAWVAGFAGGLTSALFGAGGPPYAIYLSQRGLSKAQFRATLGFATLTSISLRVVAFVVSGILLERGVWIAALAVLPAAWLGLSLARRVFQRVSRATLLRAVSMVLVVSGASLVLRALA